MKQFYPLQLGKRWFAMALALCSAAVLSAQMLDIRGIVTDEAGELFRYAQCAETVCGEQTYTVRTQPRTIGVRFSQEF